MRSLARSDSTLKLDAALFAVRGELTPILKSAANPFFKSRYADLPATIQTLDPVFRKHGILVLQAAVESNDYESVVLNITTELIHVESGEYRLSTLTLPLKSQDPQQLGSAVTYGRRYLWQLVAGAETEDDDGNASTFPNGKGPKAKGPRAKKDTPATKASPVGKYSGATAPAATTATQAFAQPAAEATTSSKPSETATSPATPTSTTSPSKTKGSRGKYSKKAAAPKAELPTAIATNPDSAFTYKPKD
jgi:hypothetical protein